MADFICITQEQHLQSFKAPSDSVYHSMKGTFFKVENKLDVAYFRSKRQFRERGVVEAVVSRLGKDAASAIAPPSDPKPTDARTELISLLTGPQLKATKKQAEFLADAFNDEPTLHCHYDQGKDVLGIPSKLNRKLKDYFQNNYTPTR